MRKFKFRLWELWNEETKSSITSFNERTPRILNSLLNELDA